MKRVMLVEDSPDDVLLFQLAWKNSGATLPVHVVPDGAEALRYLLGEDKYHDRQQYPLPCLVLLDLKLPRVMGLEVIKRLREDPDLRKLVVIVLTSSGNEGDIEQAYELGANSYLVKPSANHEREELVDLLQRYWLGKNKLAPSLNYACAQ